ncbi:MAG: GH3 auxin-responsive promoter family protein [Fibrobacteres bacterium]|nr:GH3 auxin-responsive promoter family protein [Fibrobacterota bacterium]
MKFPYLANAAWSLASRPEALAFERGLRDVETVQRALLRDLLARNRDSGYGKEHGFSTLVHAEAYRDRVPVADYDDMEPWIRRAARGEKALTAESVLVLEPTGGSQGGSKWIPYTASLRKEFRRGLAPWIHSMFRRFPAAMRGTAYWSLSPPLQREPGFEYSVKAGFESDADYLGPLGRILESQAFAAPSSVLRERNADAFFHLTASHLLASEDLALISVWNPTFLALLLDRIRADRESLLRGLRDGGRGARARTVARALDGSEDRAWIGIWPRLALISCWRDGWAAGPADRLAEFFPGVAFQAKGLLATEALVSLPWHVPETLSENGKEDGREDGTYGAPLHLLNYRGHFFEFLDVESGKTRFAWETKAGGVYSVLVTTGGGLYRYRLRDLVRIEGFRSACPAVRFLSKEESFSDLTGEKLQSDFVQHCAEQALAEAGIGTVFYLLAPEPDATPPRYALHVGLEGDSRASALEARLEAALEGNFQYGLSRKLGQLAPVRVVPAGPGAESRYYYYKGLRAKLGDIKWKPLESSGPWADILRSKHP